MPYAKLLYYITEFTRQCQNIYPVIKLFAFDENLHNQLSSAYLVGFILYPLHND